MQSETLKQTHRAAHGVLTGAMEVRALCFMFGGERFMQVPGEAVDMETGE